MLIQCQTCNAKYRLNLEKIPNRKTFIKCRQCTAPIYIDPQEEALPEETQPVRILAPSDGDTVTVGCTECDAKYKIQRSALKRPGMMLKCSACGNKFAAPEELTPHAAPPAEPKQPFFPSAGATDSHVGEDTEMPVPNDNRMDSLFEDLKVHSTSRKPGSTFSPADGLLGGEGKTPEDEYLDAISFKEGDSGSPAKGTIPDQQKYRFFMKPKDPSSPEEQDQPSDSSESTSPSGIDQDLPPLEQPASDLPPLEQPAREQEAGNVPMVQEDEAGPAFDHPNPPVESQFDWRQRERKYFLAILVAGFAVLVASAGWGYWLSNQRSDNTGYMLLPGQIDDLSAKTTRQGYFINNKPSGERLYILSGQVSNAFQAPEVVSWVRLEGLAYGQDGKVIGKGHSYAGNVMTDQQLSSVDLNAITTFHGYANGQDDNNFRVKGGQPIPFQLILRGIQDPVVRNEIRVSSFQRRNRQVYLKTQP